MPSNRRMKNLLRKKKRSRRLASSGVRPVLSVPEADGTSSQASQAVEPAGAERLNVGDLVPFNDDGELLISSDSDTVSAMEPPSMAEASEAEMSLTGTDESNASIIANAPSTPQLFAFEDEDAAEPQSPPCSPQSPTIVEDDASSDSDAVLSVPQTPRLGAKSLGYSQDVHLTLTHQEQDVFLLRVGGILFRVPARVAAKYPFWAAFAFMEQPPQGWSMPGVDPVIFVVLMDRVLATSELDGTEADLNLVKIFFAIALAEKWGMKEERNELRDAAYRYIVRRVLHSNPFLPDDESGVLDLSHFVYRSEELYRTWEAIQDYPVLQKILCESDLVGLYVRAIPQRFWVALTAHFKPEFSMLLHVAATVLTGRPEANFQHWWLRYFRMAGYLEADWLSCGERDEIFGPVGRQNEDPAAVQNWEEFQAARARGNALTAAFDAREGREQLAGPATPVTPANTDGDIYDATPRGSPSRCRRRSRVRFIHLPEVITPPQEGSRSQADIESSADDEVEDDEVEETDEAQEDGASSA
ncbi:hypothetical protein Trco_000094 [Trichoderma cornu-damae]|uniref:Uncharacterized protein n=1 Tax=Trichoderma cornu-damae TaxID=654480 RepID=A0A9P8U013_9HYPO|nr:hypothetical protein Trco_000094 [Trichoderma cornu-damae]